MKTKRRKPKFRVGQVVGFPVKIVKVDRRTSPVSYTIGGAVGGWIMEDKVWENEFVGKRERSDG